MTESILIADQTFAVALCKTLDGQIINTKDGLKRDIGIQKFVAATFSRRIQEVTFSRRIQEVGKDWVRITESIVLIILNSELLFRYELIVIKITARVIILILLILL